ncbi:MAG TPA: PilT/PilU family type 4a pilus ATPase [Phycisphaerae bacterium]|nr:PilT/PilU family type 4a pilus ATPase [Phycisphaerae bacterium]HOI55450.1 PilT/PilU family type 4a pilus ATPase [Phycisphaerae bacterium]
MVQVELNGKQVELTLGRLFALASQFKASDLHLKHEHPPVMRIDGEMKPTTLRPLTDKEIEELVFEIMNERVREDYLRIGSADFAVATDSGDRFRVNVFRQRNFTSVSCRRVIRDIPAFEALHLPRKVLETLCARHQGLIIFAGQTGSGKSTSIAACLDHINRTRACHIVTLEDPIEYLFEDQKAMVSQREIGTDVESMDLALKYLMREDPDVVLIGEMRDRDTFEAAVRAAETGHLVFATLHASSPASAIGRILDLYPDYMQKAVRQNLAFNLAGIVCQILLPSCAKDTKRIPATEILVMTGLGRKLVRDAEDNKLDEVIAAGSSEGMMTFTSSFVELVSGGWITHSVAYEYAPNQDALKMALKGISVKQGIIR